MSGTGSVGSVLLDTVAFGDVYWRPVGAILHSVSWLMSGTGSVGSVMLYMVASSDVYWSLECAIMHSVSWV